MAKELDLESYSEFWTTRKGEFLLVEIKEPVEDYTAICRVSDEIRGGISIEDDDMHRAVVAKMKSEGVPTLTLQEYQEKYKK